MRKRAKLFGYIIGMVAFIFTIVGFTYAMYVKSLYNVNVSASLKNLGKYIIYSRGITMSSASLEPTSSYTSGTSASVTFYRSNTAPYDIYGHIYLDINTLSSEVASALKYTVVDNTNSSIIGSGSFDTYTSGSSLLSASNILLNDSETIYTVYVWLDEDLYDSSITSSSIDISIRCHATANVIGS